MATNRDWLRAAITVGVLLGAVCFLMVSECLKSANQAVASAQAVVSIGADRREPTSTNSAQRRLKNLSSFNEALFGGNVQVNETASL